MPRGKARPAFSFTLYLGPVNGIYFPTAEFYRPLVFAFAFETADQFARKRTRAGEGDLKCNEARTPKMTDNSLSFPLGTVKNAFNREIAPLMRVLVVEDEKKTASFIRKALQAEGFAVDVCHRGDEALSAASTASFDGIVLDIMLPERDGLSVLRQLRERQNRTPVLLLSARGAVNERVEGLDAGADDYLPKPFVIAELVARVRALGRRGSESKSTVLRVANLTLDTISHRAGRDGKFFDLTAREFRLLEFLMRSAGRICGRMSIIEKVWDYDFDPGTNLVDVYIKRLREKIDEEFEPKLLHTVRGVGYVLKE
jgi:DNA-binding response OmpR family regulator